MCDLSQASLRAASIVATHPEETKYTKPISTYVTKSPKNNKDAYG